MRRFGAVVTALVAVAALAACGIPDTQRSPLVRLVDLERDTRPDYDGAWLATLEVGNRSSYSVQLRAVDLVIEAAGQGDQEGLILAEGGVDLRDFWIVGYDREQVVVPVTQTAALQADASSADILAAVAEGSVYPRGTVRIDDGPTPIPFGPQPYE